MTTRNRTLYIGGAVLVATLTFVAGLALGTRPPQEPPLQPQPTAGMDAAPDTGTPGMGGMDMGGMSMDGSIRLSQGELRTFGVTFGTAEVRPLSKTIRTTGMVEFDERRMAYVSPKFGGWVERLHVDFTGQPVRRGEPLLEVYSPELVTAQEELLLAARMAESVGDSPVGQVAEGATDLLDSARRRLAYWDLSGAQIERLLETREVRKTMTLHAPVSGIVMEKDVFEGQAFRPGQNLYMIADLSSVWVNAEIFESDAALVREGMSATLSIPALPGRTLTGRIEYVYPTVGESTLSAVDAGLTRRIEREMMALREAVASDAATVQDVERRGATVLGSLDEAERVGDGSGLTAGVVFLSSLVILLREGLEAILILAAISAFMIKTGRRNALRYVHAGWIGALALGGATWAVSTWLLSIGGATRELTEGLTALFAALMLFYVGFWMHNKVSARRWNEYVREHVGKALDGGTPWLLALLSFVAVYREVFETVLFYQALWAQTEGAGQSFILAGGAAAAVLLSVSAWLIFKAGVRLPLQQFFGASAAVMITLAMILAGKGIAALQEAGRLPSSPLEFLPRIDLLGLYPNWQTVGVQLAMIAVAFVLVMHNRRVEPARA